MTPLGLATAALNEQLALLRTIGNNIGGSGPVPAASPSSPAVPGSVGRAAAASEPAQPPADPADQPLQEESAVGPARTPEPARSLLGLRLPLADAARLALRAAPPPSPDTPARQDRQDSRAPASDGDPVTAPRYDRASAREADPAPVRDGGPPPVRDASFLSRELAPRSFPTQAAAPLLATPPRTETAEGGPSPGSVRSAPQSRGADGGVSAGLARSPVPAEARFPRFSSSPLQPDAAAGSGRSGADETDRPAPVAERGQVGVASLPAVQERTALETRVSPVAGDASDSAQPGRVAATTAAADGEARAPFETVFRDGSPSLTPQPRSPGASSVLETTPSLPAETLEAPDLRPGQAAPFGPERLASPPTDAPAVGFRPEAGDTAAAPRTVSTHLPDAPAAAASNAVDAPDSAADTVHAGAPKVGTSDTGGLPERPIVAERATSTPTGDPAPALAPTDETALHASAILPGELSEPAAPVTAGAMPAEAFPTGAAALSDGFPAPVAIQTAAIADGLAALGLAAIDAGGAMPLPERAGVIASFILNAHFIPGWPPPRPIAGAEAAVTAGVTDFAAELTEDEMKKLLYLASLGLTPAQIERAARLMLAARRRSKLFDALAVLLTNLGRTLETLQGEVAAILEEMADRPALARQAAGRHRRRIDLR